jgi:predicted ribosomally synthesized peptide with SipW-like signal peptide
MKKKALISSILTIALCMSLIAGSTYALFTSSAKVNVSATAGTVEIYATVDESSIASGSTLGDKTNLPETSFTFDEGSNTIVLDKIVPGDYVDFNILINNQGSNVSIKYRTVIKVAEDNGLWSGLVATIDGESYTGEYKSSEWEVLAPGAGEITVPVRIELPAAAGNKYQGKTCKIAYLVEAVQMNGTIE